MPRPKRTRVCRVPACNEVLRPLVWLPLCADCRLLFASWAAFAALVLAFALEVMRRLG